MEWLVDKRAEWAVHIFLGLAVAFGLLLAVIGLGEIAFHWSRFARGLSEANAATMRRLVADFVLTAPVIVAVSSRSAFLRSVESGGLRDLIAVVAKSFFVLLGVVVLEAVTVPTSPLVDLQFLSYGNLLWAVLLVVPLLLASGVWAGIYRQESP